MIEQENGTLGEKLTWLRKRHELSQTDAAKRIGIHGRHLSRLETNKLMPTSKTLHKIADAYGVGVEELLGDGGQLFDIHDPRMVRVFQQAQRLDDEDKKFLARMVQALLLKKRMARVLENDEGEEDA